LHGYSDSDFAGDIEYRKSTSGYVFFFAGGVISCQSKRQTITALSTTEAEYYALYKAVIEDAWLRYIFKDVKSVKIYKDNQGSLQLSQNPELHQRTKILTSNTTTFARSVLKALLDSGIALRRIWRLMVLPSHWQGQIRRSSLGFCTCAQ
jgi:hypothetical protein